MKRRSWHDTEKPCKLLCLPRQEWGLITLATRAQDLARAERYMSRDYKFAQLLLKALQWQIDW